MIYDKKETVWKAEDIRAKYFSIIDCPDGNMRLVINRWVGIYDSYTLSSTDGIKFTDKVGIIDMNLLCKPEALDILRVLPVNNGKIIEYEFICGIDHRFLTKEIAVELKKHHMKRIRIAWDWFLKDQFKILDCLKVLYSVGFTSKNIIIFMICNHPSVSYDECMKKLDLCKVWNVQVADCYYDNQIDIIKKFVPIGWTTKQAHDFRRRCRVHNLIVKRGIYPELDNIQFKNEV